MLFANQLLLQYTEAIIGIREMTGLKIRKTEKRNTFRPEAQGFA